jgi:hypothetical protein
MEYGPQDFSAPLLPNLHAYLPHTILKNRDPEYR